MLPFPQFFCYMIDKDAHQQTGVGNFNMAAGLAAYRNGSEKNFMYGGWLSLLFMLGIPPAISISGCCRRFGMSARCGLSLEWRPQQRWQQRQLLVVYAEPVELEQRLQPQLQLGQRELEQQQPQQRSKRSPRR